MSQSITICNLWQLNIKPHFRNNNLISINLLCFCFNFRKRRQQNRPGIQPPSLILTREVIISRRVRVQRGSSPRLDILHQRTSSRRRRSLPTDNRYVITNIVTTKSCYNEHCYYEILLLRTLLQRNLVITNTVTTKSRYNDHCYNENS